MKTFLFEIPRLLRVKSKELDVTAALINRSWLVFNDEGIKQVFVFLEGGKVLVSTNGSVSYSQWSYYAVNQALVISSDNKGLMFHPAFVDDKVFALQLDGTKEVLFMIDEGVAPSFVPKTLSDLKAYFVQKEMLKALPQSNTKQKEVIVEEQTDIIPEPIGIKHLLEEKRPPSDIADYYAEVSKDNYTVGNFSHADSNVLTHTEWEEVKKEYAREKRGNYILGTFFLTLAFLFLFEAFLPDGGVFLIFGLIFLALAISFFVIGSKTSLEKKTQERLSKKAMH